MSSETTNMPASRWRRIPRGPGLGPQVAALFWSYLIWNLGYALYATILTLYLQSIGVSPATIGVVVGGAAVGRMLLAIPAGVLVDRTAPGPVLLATMTLPVVGVFVLGAATAWWQALAAALLVELSGLGIPALSVWLAQLSAPDGRTRAYTWVYTVGPQVANLAGPALAGLVAAGAGYRPVFVIAAVAFGAGVALVVPLVLAGTREARAAETVARAAADPEAGAAPTSATGADPEASETPNGGSVVAAMRDPAIRLVVLLHVLVPLLPYAGFVLAGNLLVEDRGIDVATYGLLGSFASAIGLAMALLPGHLRQLRDPFVGLAICLGAGGVGLVLLVPDAGLALLVLVYLLRGAMSPVWSYLSAAIAVVTREGNRGRAFGLAEAGAGVGDVGAPLVAGRLYAVDPVLPVVFAAVTTLPLALGAALVARRPRPVAR